MSNEVARGWHTHRLLEELDFVADVPCHNLQVARHLGLDEAATITAHTRRPRGFRPSSILALMPALTLPLIRKLTLMLTRTPTLKLQLIRCLDVDEAANVEPHTRLAHSCSMSIRCVCLKPSMQI
eukprot:5359829-Pleurochrysis_carterae.AAC.1